MARRDQVSKLDQQVNCGQVAMIDCEMKWRLERIISATLFAKIEEWKLACRGRRFFKLIEIEV
jgi:hypothetical protein